MKYIRKIISLFLIVLLLLIMASCGSTPQENGTVPAPASADNTEKEAEAEQPAETAPVKWEPQLSEEDRAILAELGTLTHHTPVTEDNLTRSFDPSTGTLTISGTGPMKDYSRDDPSPVQDYRESVKRIVVADGITTVGAYALWNLTWCESVQLPDSVEYIGEWAFANDYNIADVPFPANLREIADHGFADIMGHKPLVIPEGVEIIGKSAFVSNVFYDTISIPASAYYIEETAFANSLSVHDYIVADGNPNYTSVDGVLFSSDMSVLIDYPIYKEEPHYEIPDTVTRIGDRAFTQTYFLKSISIPASVTEFGEDFFWTLITIEEYNVDENSPILKSVDGILYSKDMKILYDYPCRKAADVYTVPESVETIAENCFLCCSRLEKLVIPGTVKTVGDYAFCKFYGEIYLAEDYVNMDVGSGALYSITTDVEFDYTTEYTYTPPSQRDPDAEPIGNYWKHVDATTVYYEGTQAQWDEFVERTEAYLDDTVVICDTPLPSA